MYEQISNTYDQLRVKAVALIAGEVALVAFIFTTSKLTIPVEYYGRIFFFTGIVSLITSFGFLFWTISALDWKMPTDLFDSDEIIRKYPTEKEFLKYVHHEYVISISHCLPRVDKRAKRFNWTLYLLAASAIVLLVIKFGGA